MTQALWRVMTVSSFIRDRKPKVKFAKELGVSPQQLHRYYLKIAYELTDFIFDFPELDGEYLKHLGLSPFQCWVLKKLREMIQGGMRHKDIFKDYEGCKVVRDDLEESLSRRAYEKELNSQVEIQTAKLIGA